jgi:hypothetical protein
MEDEQLPVRAIGGTAVVELLLDVRQLERELVHVLERGHVLHRITDVTEVAAENLEVQEAWDGVLFEGFLQYRDVFIPGLAAHGRA